MMQRIIRLIISLNMLASNKAFQFRFKVFSAPKWERHVSATPRVAIAFQSSKRSWPANCGNMSPLNSDNDTENDIIHVSSLDSTNEFDVMQRKFDGAEGLPDDVREELYSNQPSELDVLKNVRYDCKDCIIRLRAFPTS
jgi:hypothetical protein